MHIMQDVLQYAVKAMRDHPMRIMSYPRPVLCIFTPGHPDAEGLCSKALVMVGTVRLS